mgnify:CR=1 FL=1
MIQNPDTQTGSCCRAIIRYILDKGLKSGDKLPSQDELRRELDFSHNSMTPAMNLLVESGMLERKRRLGTVVVDTNAVPAGLWRVALAFGVLDITPACKFETILNRYVQEKVQRAGCHIRSYILNYDKFKACPHELSDFGLLEADIQSGRLDAVISPAFFSTAAYEQAASHSVPLCNIGGWEDVPFRVELNTRELVEQSVKLLKEKCCRSIAFIMDSEFQSNIVDFIKSEIITAPHYHNIKFDFIHGTGDEDDARKAADTLMNIAPEDRPDGLVILNDILALALTSIISNTKYSPSIVVQSNKQIPLFYPMPVTKLEFDMEKLAEVSINMVLNKVKHPQLPVTVEKIKADAPEEAAVLAI